MCVSVQFHREEVPVSVPAKTVPAVPVRRAVPAKAVPAVPVSGSVSVPGPPCDLCTKKEHKPKLLSPDIFRWGRGLPREGVGAKKFGISLETGEIKLFGWDIPGSCRDIPEVPEKFEKNCV